MQGVLIFNTEEPFEKQSFIRACKADDAYGVLWNLVHDNMTVERIQKSEDIISTLHEIYQEEGINLDEEYT